MHLGSNSNTIGPLLSVRLLTHSPLHATINLSLQSPPTGPLRPVGRRATGPSHPISSAEGIEERASPIALSLIAAG